MIRRVMSKDLKIAFFHDNLSFMSDEEKKVENTDNSADLAEELQIYELGFHILPIIAEEKLEGEVSAIKSVIEKNGGLFIGEECSPKIIKLAYSMSKDINNKKTDFDTAYFSWVKFEANSSSINKMEEELKLVGNILRFLLIKSVRESKMISRKPNVLSKPYNPVPVSKVSKSNKEGEVVSETQIDQAIDELIIE
jgi:ribosomal protein S6